MNAENQPIGNSDWLKEFHLDLEDRVGCDSNNCDSDSTMFVRYMCCNSINLSCELHMSQFVQRLLGMNERGIFAKCPNCKRHVPPLRLIFKPESLALDTSGGV